VPNGEVNGPDGLDDFWQEKFNAWAIAPGGDEDHDGFANDLEAIAGTNPFAATDSFKIGNMTIVGAAVLFSSKIEAGKKYRVLSSDTPGGPVWAAETLQTPVSSTTEYIPSADLENATISIQAPAGAKKFYKLETSDVSSSPDGISDWVKRKLGLVPGVADSNGDGVSDIDEITQVLQTPDVVTVEAENAFASEDGGPAGLLKLRRGHSLFGARVYYTLGGSAMAGSDFAALSGFVDFAPGSKTATIAITPSMDSALEGGESVIVTLNGGMAGNSTPLTINQAQKQAAVIINNTTAASGTGLTARYYDHASSTAAHAANFGDAANYAYTRAGTTPNFTGTVVVTPTGVSPPRLADLLAAITPGSSQVKLSFLGGNLNTAVYNHLSYPVSAKNATGFTCTLPPGDSLPATSSSTANFSIQPIHPAVIHRVDPSVDSDWVYGTPNDVAVTPNNPVDNYSTVFEGYLHPTSAGSYQFQLDADDKARVLLDLNNNGTFELPGEQIIEHGWDTAATIGTFNVSAALSLAVPASPAQRYKIRVEHVETTGDARCRLQWRLGTATFANISSANVFSHTRALTTYSVTSSVATITTAVAHGLSINAPVTLHFSTGNLFTPPANFSGSYTVTSVPTATTFTISVPGAANGTGAGFMADTTSTTAGWLDWVYTNTTFTAPAGRVGVLGSGPTNANNGIWGSGTPDPALIGKDTFSIRWTGQVQPQFSEVYTFSVHADDGCRLRINGQEHDLKTLPATFSSTNTTYSYNNNTGDAVVTYAGSLLPANSFAVGEAVRLDPTTGNLTHATNSTYVYDSATGDAVINYSNLTNITPGSFGIGETVEVDPTSGSVSLGQFPYVISASTTTTFTVNFGARVFESGSGNITFSDNRNVVINAATATTFTVNLGGGKYANGMGSMNIDIVNKTLNDWASMGNERYVRIPMVGGTRYDIQLDFYENTGYGRCRLFWFSPSQPKQIIPAERLYPEAAPATPLAPSAHVSATAATALVGGAFSYQIQGSNGIGINGAGVTVSGNPEWLTYANGILSGTPPGGSGGDYQILITLTNAVGDSTSLLNLHVEDTGATIPREFWSGVGGTTVADIPTGNTASGTTNLASLEAPTDFGDDYGARIRGYITAPATGNYYFWVAGSNAAELWISNDDEPINAFKRAWVSIGNATPQSWNGETSQKSPWLALQEGKRYYVEILHKAGTGAGDNLAVGWSRPGQDESGPSEIVPGHVLSPYIPPAPGSTPGTLYVATMLAQGAATTNGVGSATLRLSEDETVAYVAFTHSGLSGALTDWHVHADPYLTHASAIIYDGTEPLPGDGPQPDGTHKWNITGVGTLSVADIRELIKQGKAYINLHTAMYPAGEIRGNFTLAHGSRTFSPPPLPPAWTDDHATNPAAAVRFLTQATFGASIDDIQALQAMPSYEAWIDDQFTKPVSLHLPEVIRTELSSATGGAFDETLSFNAWWWRSISGGDQLRQRIAFALSEIHVVSAQGPLDNNARSLSYFYDRLATNALGNFRDILLDTTLTPSMGRYLDMLRNDKPDQTVGRIPNENYAREIKQLFSVGLYRMWPDGSLMLNSKDIPIDTYNQREIVGFSHVFTGWDYGYDGAYLTSLSAPANWTRQMREVPARHFTGPKLLLNNEVLPGLQTVGGGQPLDPFATHNSASFNHPAYQALPAQELAISHEQLFNHPNVGPFICRQLIQRLVTSHPSRGYLYRVVQKFNDNGFGVRGDMQAVIKAILLDYEARSPDMITKPSFGKQREPVMRVALPARVFRKDGWSGTYTQNGTRTITITTSTPHGYSTTGNQFLDFTSGSPAPWIGSYSAVLGSPSATTLSVQALGWATGSYSIPANSTTCTVTMTNHWLQVGNQVFVDFTSGTADGTAVDGQIYTVLTNPNSSSNGNNGNSFTFDVVGTSLAVRSGNMMIPRFTPGSYTTASSGQSAPNDRRVTMDTIYNHELQVGDQVQLNFYGGNPQPVDMIATVESIPDLNTWTFLAPSAGTNLGTSQGDNNVYQFPLKSLPLTRSGSVTSRQSTFAMGNTTTDLEQAPINSPTVFNFFLPDYKYPGALASQGLTTPEFQSTAETTVIRQANYLYNGIFASGQNFSSSFNNGSNALVMNFSPWMPADATNLGLGVPPSTTLPWTHNQNIDELISQMNTLLMAGQLSSQARQIIRNFVALPITSISTGNPCVVTTSVPHGYVSNDTVLISGVSDGSFSATLNSTTTTRTVTITSPTTFTIPLSCTTAPTAGGLANAHVSPVVYNQGTTGPSDVNKRDRIRTILHLILTSPDFTIQR